MLWSQRKARPRQTYTWIAYIVLLFILGSLANGINMKVNVLMFVNNRDYPGGPTAYDKATFSVPINLICTSACILGAWLQDALLVCSCSQSNSLGADGVVAALPILRHPPSNMVDDGGPHLSLHRIYRCVHETFSGDLELRVLT